MSMDRVHPRGRVPRRALHRLLPWAIALALLAPTTWAVAAPGRPGPARASGPPASVEPAAPTAHLPGKHRGPITVRVTPRFFGLHDLDLAALSRPGVGAIRLLGPGLTWADLEPSRGVFDFTLLDHAVELAHARHTRVLFLLAGTPAWAAADPGATTPSDPPRLAAYTAFVEKVMRRYRSFDPEHDGHAYRGIAEYQVWNEPNIKTFWTGTPAAMAKLVRAVWAVRQRVDRGARVIAPSLVARLPFEMRGIAAFYALRVGHRPVWRYVDAMTFSLYPVETLPSGRPAGPEDMIDLLHAVRATLAEDGVPRRLPVWDSEVNYGLPAGKKSLTPTPRISAGRQVAFVMRTYLLSAANGVPRVFWFAYDLHGAFANTFLTKPSPAPPGTLTPAGHAFYRIQRWMHGTLVGTSTRRPCARDRRGTYTCVVRYAHGVARIYWNPHRAVTVATVRSTTSWTSELGGVHAATGRRHLRVGYAPVLVRSRR